MSDFAGRIGPEPAEQPEIIKRLTKALTDDLAFNRNPPPTTVPAMLVMHDPQTSLIRIAHARQLDLHVEIVYLRVADLKKTLAGILQLEAMVESTFNPDLGRALGGELPLSFDA